MSIKKEEINMNIKISADKRGEGPSKKLPEQEVKLAASANNNLPDFPVASQLSKSSRSPLTAIIDSGTVKVNTEEYVNNALLPNKTNISNSSAIDGSNESTHVIKSIKNPISSFRNKVPNSLPIFDAPSRSRKSGHASFLSSISAHQDLSTPSNPHSPHDFKNIINANPPSAVIPPNTPVSHSTQDAPQSQMNYLRLALQNSNPQSPLQSQVCADTLPFRPAIARPASTRCLLRRQAFAKSCSAPSYRSFKVIGSGLFGTHSSKLQRMGGSLHLLVSIDLIQCRARTHENTAMA